MLESGSVHLVFQLFEPYIFSNGPLSGRHRLFTSLRDGTAVALACDGWSRMLGQPAIGIISGDYHCLQAVSALTAAHGDRVNLFIVCFISDQISAKFEKTARAVARVSSISKALAQFKAGKLNFDSRSIQLPGPLIFYSTKSQSNSLTRLLTNLRKLSIGMARQARKQRYALEQTNLSKVGEISQAVQAKLKSSKRPVILLDRIALETIPVEVLRSLSNTMLAPLVLTTRAAGVAPHILGRLVDNFPVGRLLYAAQLPYLRVLRKVDLLISLATEFRESEIYGLHDFNFIKLKQLKDHALVIQTRTEALEFTRQLARLQLKLPPKRQVWLEYVKRYVFNYQRMVVHLSKRPHLSGRFAGLRLNPAFVARRVCKQAYPAGILMAEGNASGMWAWSVRHKEAMLYPDRMANIGVLTGWAVGAGLARLARPVDIHDRVLASNENLAGVPLLSNLTLWGFCGDGSFLYDASQLRALVENKIGINLIIFNNSAWSAIRLEQTFVFEGKYPGTRMPELDCSAICREHGVESQRVQTASELEAALEYATVRQNKDHAPFVIEAITPADGVPLAGLPFALAELDYIYSSNRLRIVRSILKSMLHGRYPWRLSLAALRFIL